MSYLNHAQDPRRRAAALTATVAVHALLGVAVITGLTIAGTDKVEDGWDPFVVTPDRPKDPPPPPPDTPDARSDSVITAPLPPLDLRPADPVVDAVLPDATPEPFTPLPDPGPPLTLDPPPRPTFAAKKVVPSNNAGSWVTTEDYPASELRNEVEGLTGYRLVIGTNGRVASCEIVRSSGSNRLDDAACRRISQRARFDPATDETGGKVVGTYAGTVKWEIPD
jgi:protein TonB